MDRDMRTSPHQWCRRWRCLCAGVMVLLPMAGMAGVRPRADAAEVLQVAGPCSVTGELARTLLLLEQRHLDTLAQMAVRASTTTRWKSPSGRVDMSGVGGNGGSA
uniref:Uncharacterized protein n=1 Tax=Brassica oleracea var. oleracea TaxID=109376 RepID=A0A0D3AAM5_BRAOL